MPSTLVTTQAGRLLSSKGGRGRRIRGAARCGEAPSRLKVSLAEGGAGVSFRQQFSSPQLRTQGKLRPATCHLNYWRSCHGITLKLVVP